MVAPQLTIAVKAVQTLQQRIRDPFGSSIIETEIRVTPKRQPMIVLIAHTDALRRDRIDELIQPIRAGLGNWDIPLDGEVAPRPVGLIRADVEEVLAWRREADYQPMARMLPSLIDETVHAVHTTGGETRQQAYEDLGGAFRCVFALAWSFG